MSTKIPRTVGGALCAVGAGLSLLILIAVLLSSIAHPREAWIPQFTKGTIVRYDLSDIDATGRRLPSALRFPVVSFHDRSGDERSFRSDAGFKREPYALGVGVTVVYLPQAKGGQEMVSPATMWGARIWLGLALAIVAAVCIFPFIALAYALLNGRRVRDVILTLRHAPRSAQELQAANSASN